MTAVFDPGRPDAVSVVIPTYNRGWCLGRAMRSVLLQTHGNLELIIADDASTDDTEAVVRAFDDPRVVYLRQDHNQGASAARNLGLRHVRGAYVTFHDSDDEWLLEKLERQLRLLESLPPEYGGVFGSKLCYGRDLKSVYGPDRVAIAPETGRKVTSGALTDQLLDGNMISPQTLLLRRAAFEGMEGFDSRLPNNNDWDFMLRLSQRTLIHFDPVPVVVDYISPDSIQGNLRGKVRSMTLILRKHRSLFERKRRALSHKYYTLGRNLLRVHRPRAARRAQWRAIRLAPFTPRPWYGLLTAELALVKARRAKTR